MDALISVVIPVYNVENYLDRCIESVMRQTYETLEIILIDDGSSDNSGAICDAYVETDKRIKVIHQCNGGLSSARNTGINEANGEYITFVDSDDSLWEEAIEKLYNLALRYKADTVQGLYTYSMESLGSWDGKERIVVFPTGREALINYLHCDILNEASTVKLFKHSLFDEIRFPEGMISEDTLTTYKLIYKSQIVVSFNQFIYYYMYNDKGILHSRFNIKRFDILRVFEEMPRILDLSDKSLLSAYHYYEARRLLFFYNQGVALGALSRYPDELEAVRKRALESVSSARSLGIKYSLLFILLRHSPRFYHLLIQTVRKPEREVSEGEKR